MKGKERSDDSGVSPVVGMILVLGISVVGIAAILYWGLPAIEEMKANVEFRSVQTQFAELDSTIRELVAGTTEKTAKRWQPSINRGSVSVMNDTEPWLYAVEFYNKTNPFSSGYTNFSWGNLTDGDNVFTLKNMGRDLPYVKIEAVIITGTSSFTALNVSVDKYPVGGVLLQSNDPPASIAGPPLGHAYKEQMDSSWIGTWTNRTSINFGVFASSGTWPPSPHMLTGDTIRFRVYTGTTLLAEAWYINTTRVDYTLRSSLGDKYVIANNGALITGASNSYLVTNSPPTPPISNASGVPRFFGRVVAVEGTTSFAGDNRFDLLISLYSTNTLASYDCGKGDGSDCAISAKIYTWGKYAAPWQSYLTNTNIGYKFLLLPDGMTPTGKMIEQREWRMAFTLLESNVRVT